MNSIILSDYKESNSGRLTSLVLSKLIEIVCIISNYYEQEEKPHVESEKVKEAGSTRQVKYFIDPAPESESLTQALKEYLREHDQGEYQYQLPEETTPQKMTEIHKQLRKNLLWCDEVIIPISNEVPPAWLLTHLRQYQKVQIDRETPLRVKIYSPSMLSFDFNMPNLSVRQCFDPQTCIEELANV